jgi:hypothetical protein
MLGKGRNQKKVADEIAEDARLAAAEHRATLDGLGKALGKPPQELVKLVKEAKLDPKHPVPTEELMRRALELLGDKATEAQALAARMYEAPAPLSPTACPSGPRKRRRAR